MHKVVIYGAVKEDALTLAHIIERAEVVFEKDPINDNNFHQDASIVAMFTNSIFESKYITPTLRAVITRSTGWDHIRCKDELIAKGIEVMRNTTYATGPVAEYSLGAITQECSAAYFASGGAKNKLEFAALKVVIIGSGAISLHLKNILDAIGCTVTVVSSQGEELVGGIEYARLGEVLVDADIICLHAGLSDANEKIASKGFFEKVKKGTIVINAARGELVTNKDLLNALKLGKIKRAYLDLIQSDNDAQAILEHPNVVFTNHTAWRTNEALMRSQNFLKRSVLRIIEAT